MRTFSLISIADEKEFFEKHRLLNVLRSRFKDFIVSYVPDYISGVVNDIGVVGYNISGCRICVPTIGSDNLLLQKKLYRAVNRSKHFGADVIVVDPSINMNMKEEDFDIRISRGRIYPPYIFIDAVKTVSALMGINFNRANICIANASTAMGRVMTELLLNEAAYLTLCTDDKESIMERLDNYIINTGLSPAVISSYKKAMDMCDILIYTGNVNLREVTSYVNKKALIVNLTDEKVKIEKDLLTIDEVVLKGQNEPVVSGDQIDKNIFLTSRAWEGALLTLSDIDTRTLTAKKALKLGELSRKLGLKMSSVIRGGKSVDRETIYKYR